MSEDRLVLIENRLTSIDGKIDDLRGGLAEVRGGLADLGHQMRVLHEDTIDRIKALAPDFEPVRREFRAADAVLKEEFDRRLSPLETLARTRSAG